jgi:acetyltransferase-like isoleucine patch superfamily enzyme
MKAALKQLLRASCLLAVSPAVLLFLTQSAITGRERAFPGWSQAFSLLPGKTGIWLRQAFLHCVARQCGPYVCVAFGTVFSHPGVSLGANAYVGHFCVIGDVTIEHDVLIASNVSVMNGVRQHGIARLDIPMREQPGSYERVTIGEDSWIGERAVVAASVGRHCIIGAGSVVLSPIPDYAIAVGTPARVIRDRRHVSASDAGSADSVRSAAQMLADSEAALVHCHP